jgi:two-component system, chemotaxis family, chemotaxis protein CheY
MGIRVLIVDDSSSIRKIIRRCLRQTELAIEDVNEAADGEEALSALATCGVDIVLSDINMPKMDGIRLLAAIRRDERWKTTPVLMITGDSSADTVNEALRLGASGFVKKPFTSMEIRDQLTCLVGSVPKT